MGQEESMEEILCNDCKSKINERDTSIIPSSIDIDWKKKYDELYAKYNILLSKIAKINPGTDPIESRISDEAVDQYVKTVVADPKLNIYAIPDAIEGALYRNVLKLMLHSIAHATDATSLVFIGHKVRLVMEPLEVTEKNPSPQLG